MGLVCTRFFARATILHMQSVNIDDGPWLIYYHLGNYVYFCDIVNMDISGDTTELHQVKATVPISN